MIVQVATTRRPPQEITVEKLLNRERFRPTSADRRLRHHGGVRVGVIDVGSNTVRLLVANGDETLAQRRVVLGLGGAIEESGSIPEPKLAETTACVAELVAIAHRQAVEQLEVLVTSPGRQAANGDELLERLAAAAKVPVRLLTAADEGRLAFLGAIASRTGLRDKVVAVCDVGGGSAQVTIGTADGGIAWTRSLDIGSRRLASRSLPGDPPGEEAVEQARAEVAPYLDGFAPPRPHVALAVGGSARSLRSLVGSRLGTAELRQGLDLLARTPSDELADGYGLDRDRVPTLAAGAVILAAIQERLGVPLRLGRGGLREGAVLELEARRAAAYEPPAGADVRTCGLCPRVRLRG
jgi:exopolyphosphatase/guanosine-5'-triphosphate,3'-diphosphate pyrophosphatase